MKRFISIISAILLLSSAVFAADDYDDGDIYDDGYVYIFLFLALFARVGFVVPDHPVEQAVGYAGVLAGAIVWWLCLTTALNRLGSRFEMSTICLLNRLLGLLVMVGSVVGLFYTLFR